MRDENSLRVPFVLYPEQKYVLNVLKLLRHPQRNDATLLRVFKARKRGMSTMFVADMLHKFMYSGLEQWGQIYGHEKESGDNLFLILRAFYEQLPEDERLHLRKNTDKKWIFDTKSRIDVRTIKGEGLSKSATPDYSIMTEVAMYGKNNPIKQVISGVTFNPQVTWIEESTSNGYDGYWYESHMEFEARVNDLRKRFAGQFNMPTREQQLRGRTVALELLRAGLWPKQTFFHVFIPWFWNVNNRETDELLMEELKDTITDHEKNIQELYNLSDEQVAWYRKRYNLVQGDMALLKQEYPCSAEESFVATGNSFFDLDAISILKSRVQHLPDILTISKKQESSEAFIRELNKKKEYPRETLLEGETDYIVAPKKVGPTRYMEKEKAKVEFRLMEGGRWTIAAPPVSGWVHRYLCAVDPAEGKKDSDVSVIGIFDRYLRRFVAVFGSQCGVDDLPEEIAKICTWYNFCPVMIERNGPGQTVLLGLRHMYTRILSATKTERGYDDISTSDLGIYMTGQSARSGLKFRSADLLNSFIKEEAAGDSAWGMPFEEVLQQMTYFMQDTLKAEGKQHDDYVTMSMIALETDRIMSTQGLHPKEVGTVDKPRFYVEEDPIPSIRCM